VREIPQSKTGGLPVAITLLPLACSAIGHGRKSRYEESSRNDAGGVTSRAGTFQFTLIRDTASHPLLSLNGGGYSSGGLQFTGMAAPALTVTVQATTNFLQWTNLGSVTVDTNGEFSFTDTNAFLLRCCFYRATNQ
jgi:hypothetical protein